MEREIKAMEPGGAGTDLVDLVGDHESFFEALHTVLYIGNGTEIACICHRHEAVVGT